MSTGYVHHPAFLTHDAGPSHPESPDRLRAIMGRLGSGGIADRLTSVEARPATRLELLAVHDDTYLEELEKMAGQGGGWLDADTHVSPGSWKAALYAAGGSVAAVEAVMEGRVSHCMVLARPPGHHAFRNRGSGFCLLNNVAIAATAARRKYGLNRVAIIDFDVHHGNGTQAIFEGDHGAYYVSTHQYPHYPGTGGLGGVDSYQFPLSNQSERSTMNYKLSTPLNIPLPSACGDKEYLRVFDEIILPAVRRFNPGLILVSAGYDGHWADPLAGMNLPVSGFAAMVGRIKNLAEDLCGGRLVLCLEGGYHLEALAASVAATFQILLGDSQIDDPLDPPPDRLKASPDISTLIADLKNIHYL
ncbi:histone deacetylase [Dehalogenimonas sp. THU2]|uniref:histone deacetylase family protein n=1 Tax=Dehalogenimonas sp. THU2 TaxID=3151121 RepID=UPI0032187693